MKNYLLKRVHFCGMPIALVVAKSQEIAEAAAAKLIVVDFEILEPMECRSRTKKLSGYTTSTYFSNWGHRFAMNSFRTYN